MRNAIVLILVFCGSVLIILRLIHVVMVVAGTKYSDPSQMPLFISDLIMIVGLFCSLRMKLKSTTKTLILAVLSAYFMILALIKSQSYEKEVMVVYIALFFIILLQLVLLKRGRPVL